MYRNRWILILVFPLIAVFSTWGQTLTPIHHTVAEPSLPDSADLEYYGKKDFAQASLTVVGLNTGVWAFDRFVRDTDYSHISFKTIGENFKHFFKWDNDELATNMFGHPYHGNLYFNAARSNGYNYWQSGLFALGGSALWELCMENEYPSTNDIISTPIGGMAVGEVAYRTSDIVLDDRTTGWCRAGREAAAFVISPMRGLTRIINGDAWRHRDTSGRQFGTPDVAIEYSAGVRALEMKSPFFDSGAGFTSELNIEYGDAFEAENCKPFDYFTFRADINIHSSQPLLDQLNIMGRLMGTELYTDSLNRLNLGMYQHFDYYDSDTISTVSEKVPYRLGSPASIGAGVMYRFGPEHWAFDAYLHTNAVLLGGILSDHYKVFMRDYNLASGFSIKTGMGFKWKDEFSITTLMEYFRLFTIFGYKDGIDLQSVNPRTINVQGDKSATSFIVFEARADLRLWKRLYATLAFSLYNRSSHYEGAWPWVRSTTTSTRAMLTWKF